MDNFIKENSHLNIRTVVLKEVDKMIMLIKTQTHKLRSSLINWKLMILKDFYIAPFTCLKFKTEFESTIEMVE